MADSDPLTCYNIRYNFVTSTNQFFPCGGGNGGGAQSCCDAGDYCMEDSICHYTQAVTNGTGYYMAGCTDPTWQDPACPKACTSEYDSDVIYDTTNDQWNCCVSRDGLLDCQQPSNFTVQAPGPQSLSTLTWLNTATPSALFTSIGCIASDVAAISETPGSASTSSSSPSSTPTPDSPVKTVTAKALANPTSDPSDASFSNSSDPSLSGGTIAGIVVGIIALLTLIAVGALLLRRRNQRKAGATATSGERRDYAPPSSEMAYSELGGEGGLARGEGAGPSEVDGSNQGQRAGRYHELSSAEKAKQVAPQELPGSAEQKPVELAGDRAWR